MRLSNKTYDRIRAKVLGILAEQPCSIGELKEHFPDREWKSVWRVVQHMLVMREIGEGAPDSHDVRPLYITAKQERFVTRGQTGNP